MAGITTIGAMAPRMGARANRELVRSVVALDLSGAAQSNIVVFHTETSATLTKVSLLYTEASSGDAGVTVTVGKEGSAAYYYTGTSEINKSQWYTKDVTLLQTDVPAGGSVICGNAGSKTGTGEIIVVAEFEYKE